MDSTPAGTSSSAGIRIATIVLTLLLYAAGKWLTASIPTPWGVGELLVGVFLPALMAVMAETLPVAIGAGLGTLVGDLFVTGTNSALSLVAGVPANFIAFLLFGWFVKKYRSWSAFVAATIAFVTFGNLMAATSVYLFAKQLIGITVPSSAILGLTIFWNTTSIPAVIIAVPLLVRILGPLRGRSRILAYYPEWSSSIGGRQAVYSLLFAVLFIALGGAAFLLSPTSVATEPGLGYFAAAGVIVLVFGPLASALAGSKRK